MKLKFNFMTYKLIFAKFIFVIFFASMLSVVIMFSGCVDNEVKTVTIEVTDAGQKIGYGDIVELAYDGNPKKFDIKLKDSITGEYLEDNDFGSNGWKYYVQLLIRYEDADGYIELADWDNDWPAERGYYEIWILFNNHAPGGPKENSPEYNVTWFDFILIIE